VCISLVILTYMYHDARFGEIKVLYIFMELFVLSNLLLLFSFHALLVSKNVHITTKYSCYTLVLLQSTTGRRMAHFHYLRSLNVSPGYLL